MMIEFSELEKARYKKLLLLKKEGMELYPRTTERTHFSSQAIAAFEQAEDGVSVRAEVAGRLHSIRSMGKVVFAHLEDEKGKLQLFLRRDDLGDHVFDLFVNGFDLGDFIQASGEMFRTRTGEITLRVEHFTILAKAITPLPAGKEEIVDGERKVHSAFTNPEARYRQRYADLAVNREIREIFWTKARIVSALREFLNEQGFIEVETPILQPIYGGAAAKPFTTHHLQLHQDLYLRVSFELYLKRLIVGGFERVYEIGRDFRNEGVSFKHNPEFTQLEFYIAYADYKEVMKLTEQMVAFAAEKALGSSQL